jgi:hypothetical protein
MNEPKRWSSQGSEVDPVLRSVMRYGRDMAPDSRQLQRILRVSERPRPTRHRRRFLGALIVGFAAAFGGAAWATYGGALFQSAFEPRSSDPAAAPAAPRAGGRPLAPPQPQPREQPAETPAAPRAPAPLVARQPAAEASANAAQDAELLQQARRSVVTEPARALELITEHQQRFPRSVLTEERQALRIEGLLRIGRRSEAERELGIFETRSPRSLYLRRLRALTLGDAAVSGGPSKP